MTIYHRTNGKLFKTVVRDVGTDKEDISHYEIERYQLNDDMLDIVSELEDMCSVYVKGGTFKGAKKRGAFQLRDGFEHYINNTKFI